MSYANTFDQFAQPGQGEAPNSGNPPQPDATNQGPPIDANQFPAGNNGDAGAAVPGGDLKTTLW